MSTQEHDDPIGAAARRLFNDIFDDASARRLQPGPTPTDHAPADRLATDDRALERPLADDAPAGRHPGGSTRSQSIQTAWAQCVEGGFVHALLPEAQGGIGLTLPEFFTTALAAGACASPLPLVHTALLLRLLTENGVSDSALPEGPITYAERLAIHDGVMSAVGVPWSQVSRWAVAQTVHGVWLLPIDQQASDARTLVCQGTEPHAWMAAGGQAVSADADTLRGVAAAGYSVLLAGVLEQMLAMTVRYAGERQQFGKPIGRFQAIQQQISAMAERVIAARMAAQMGFIDDIYASRLDALAVAKAITSEVVPMASSIAHAVHGAIGVTEEYALQRYSGAAHSWRGAAGGEVFWRRWIGQRVLADRGLPRDFLRTHLAGARVMDAA